MTSFMNAPLVHIQDFQLTYPQSHGNRYELLSPQSLFLSWHPCSLSQSPEAVNCQGVSLYHFAVKIFIRALTSNINRKIRQIGFVVVCIFSNHLTYKAIITLFHAIHYKILTIALILQPLGYGRRTLKHLIPRAGPPGLQGQHIQTESHIFISN